MKIQMSDFPHIKWKNTEWGEFPVHFSENACRIVSAQYFRNGEQSFWEVVERVVEAIAYAGEGGGYFGEDYRSKDFTRRLANGILEQRFAFNSPVWYNVGINNPPQCSACFIQSVDDNMESIMQLATNEAMLFKHGSGTGTNLSTLRSSKEQLSKSDGFASGPVSFMKMYDSVAGAIKSGGRTRRAAKMQILDIDHPDIEEFIWAKADEGTKAKEMMASGRSPEDAYGTVAFQNLNTSVRIPDSFMYQECGGTTQYRAKSPLCHLGHANNGLLFRQVAEAAWECGDPGVQFSDVINRANPVPKYGTINASNPCSEFVFLDETACNLASMNALYYQRHPEDFEYDVRCLIYAMDIIVGMAAYPTEQIQYNSLVFRPLGLGLTNLAAAALEAGYNYGSKQAQDYFAAFAKDLAAAAGETSAELAELFGRPEWWSENAERVLYIQTGVKRPMRNAQLTLMAPTGTISFMMDCESTGVEPVFCESMTKKLASGETITITPECVARYTEKTGKVPTTAIGSRPATPDEHLDMMAAMQPFLSGAISKTVNLPATATVEDVQYVYRRAWELGLKCVAVFRDGCKGYQPLEAKKPRPGEMVEVKSLETMEPIVATQAEARPDTAIVPNYLIDKTPWGHGDSRRRMPVTRRSITHKFSVGGVEGYLHVGEYDSGEPGELFVHISKAGSTVGGLMDAWATAFSLGLQYGVPLEKLVSKFKNSRFEPSGFAAGSEIKVASSLVDYVVRWLEQRYVFLVPQDTSKQDGGPRSDRTGDTCGVCGSMVVQTGTCKTCPSCGWNGGCG